MIGTLNEQILGAESVFSIIEWSLWSECLLDKSASLSFAETKCKCLFVSLFCVFVVKVRGRIFVLNTNKLFLTSSVRPSAASLNSQDNTA